LPAGGESKCHKPTSTGLAEALQGSSALPSLK
jgi:hypothetical protein